MLLLGTLLFPAAACNKEWLEAKPDKSLLLPVTVKDYQALLENYSVLSRSFVILGECTTDDTYLPYNTWLSLSEEERNIYVWAKDPYTANDVTSWNATWQAVLNSNVALEGIEKVAVTTVNEKDWRSVKGQALAQRAFSFFNLTQVFCRQYDPQTAATDLGIPLKLSADINEPVQRSTLQQTYDRITGDLETAKTLLPDIQPVRGRPSSVGVAGLLARIYLSMGRYADAYRNADEYLQHTNTLIDYNTVNGTRSYPFTALNEEVSWHCELSSTTMLGNRSGLVDTLLYRSYSDNDLRKTLFYTTGGVLFRGMYTGFRNYLFCGIATDEQYLIRAECLARTGRINDAMEDLRTLLEKRYLPNTYVSPVVNDETAALQVILAERRKELYLRGVRWSDLRRLNLDPRFQVTLKRILDGQEYTLPPNDNRYTFPIPKGEIDISGIAQNP